LVRCEFDKLSIVPYGGYVDLRDNNPVFSDLIANSYYGGVPAVLVRDGSVMQVAPLFVSANYFRALGVAPLYGRTFLPEEEVGGAEPVVVLSYRTWQRLGAQPEILGKEYVRVNGALCRIIGVAPKTFAGTAVVGPDIWLPLGTGGLVRRSFQEKPEKPTELWYYPPYVLVGRLKPGVSVSEAQAGMQSMVPRPKQMYPKRFEGRVMFRLRPLPRLNAGAGDNDRPVLDRISLGLMGAGVIGLVVRRRR